MHKFILSIALALGIGYAFAEEVQSADFRVPASGPVKVLLSDDAAAKPVAIAFSNLTPSGGNFTLKSVHTFADGSVVTNTIQAATTATNGAITATGYVFRGDRLLVEFSTATNGAVCLTSEIYK